MYGMRLETKEQRQQYQQAQIDTELKKGANLETFKGLKILTRHVTDAAKPFFTLMIFKDHAGHPIKNEYYRSEEHRARIIEVVKNNYESREKYKEEQKAKGKQTSGHARAAAAIREELKQKYPAFKFSVTSESFSMGNAVRIAWIDGPTDDEIEKITNKYQYGHFNGMEDIYEYSNRRDDIPQAKWVTTSRKQSEETRATMDAAALEILGEGWENRREENFYLLFNKTSLPAGAKVTGIELRQERNQLTNSYYYLTFEAPEQQPEQPAATQYEPQEVKAGTVQIVDYSERAIAVIGEGTKKIKDILGRDGLGGKFNARLSCGSGWIFPKTRLAEVQKRLLELKKDQPAPEPETIEPEPTEDAQLIEQEEKQDLNSLYKKAIEENNEEMITAIVTRKDEETPKHYSSLQAMEEAQEAGEVIDLGNLVELIEETKEEVKQQFCKPQPLHAPGFIHNWPPAPNAVKEASNSAPQNGLKLYSETQQGTNTGRAQQGFLF